MAKVSHDKESWHASGVIARDKRATKSPQDERPVGRARKKDTRRWCKGKEGREHAIVWVRYNTVHRSTLPANWLIQRCRVCHRVFEWCLSQGEGPRAKCQKHKVRHEVAE